jgi:hypothetical protein
VADKRCDNGHFIDEAWDLCPYCPQDESQPEIPVVRPTRSIAMAAPASSGEAAAAPVVEIAPRPPRPSSSPALGRDKRSDIVIHDDQASSHHADLVFRPEEKRFILMDHNSTNGTYVNETEIEPRRDLGAKDVIRIGSQRFLFTPLCHDGFHWDDEGLLK